jgi:zinc protease
VSASPDRTRPPEPGEQSPVPMPELDCLTTANGLRVFMAPRRGVPLLEIAALVEAGGEANPAPRPGLSAMTASMLDEGTARRSGPELCAELERRGGGLSSHADWNAARVRLHLLSSDLDFGLSLLAELLFEPAFPTHELERLRQQKLAELKRREDQPAALADEAFAAHLYAGSVFAHPLIGTPAALRALQRDELLAFHGNHYRHGRSSLLIAGDFDPSALAAAVEEAFSPQGAAGLRTAPSSAALPAPPAAAAAPRIVVVDRPGAEQTELRIGHLGVSRLHPDRVGLGILNTLLGGKFTSRINLNLRERHGFTYGASSRFVDRKSAGPFVVSAAVTTAATARATEEVLGELRRIREQPVADSELEDTRSYLLGVFPYGLQTVEGLAGRLDEIALYDLPLDTPARYLAEVGAIRSEELLRLAQAHLHPERALIVAVGPAGDLMAQLSSIGEPELWRPPAGDIEPPPGDAPGA